jgi:hypothetical protein
VPELEARPRGGFGNAEYARGLNPPAMAPASPAARQAHQRALAQAGPIVYTSF